MPVLCLQINIVNQLLLFIANVYFVLLCCLSLFQCLLIFSSNLFVCHKFSRLFLVQIDMLAIIYIYRITGNFCSFGLKRRHLMFADFFLLRIEKSHHRKKICLYYRKRCYDKQLVHITVIIRSKNIFNSLESFQRLQFLNTHLVNFKFVLRNYFFTVFAIYFVDRKYEVNSWIDKEL